MIRRYVSRARGQALRAAGVPKLPNLPSGRALAQRELRGAARVGVRRPRGGRQSSAGVPATSRRTVRPPSGGSPYDDESRDVGEGPDQLTPVQSFVLLLGVLFGVYLASATCGTAVVSEEPSGTNHCHTMCQFEREESHP